MSDLPLAGLLHLAALPIAVAAVLPWLRQGDWWIRVFDFPRLQLVAAGLLLLLLYRFVPQTFTATTLQAALVAATGYQLWRIRPFTPLGPIQAAGVGDAGEAPGTLSLIVANVYMPNRKAEGLLAQVAELRPDLLLVLEADAWWEGRLRGLETELPNTIKHPLPNTYGMLLYSRPALLRPEIRFLWEDDVPSFTTAVAAPGGTEVRLFCLHPRPPRPLAQQDSTMRDAELVMVGRQIRGSTDPVIVAGDLNDVAWSYTTDLFQRISGLLDPRRGRGMFNTFHTKYPFLRYPLDHIFHSSHFRLKRLERLRPFGSDHFPIFAELAYRPEADSGHDIPETEQGDRTHVRELMGRARERDGE